MLRASDIFGCQNQYKNYLNNFHWINTWSCVPWEPRWSEIPAAKGSSGPTTTRSISLSLHHLHTSSKSFKFKAENEYLNYN